MDLFRLVSTIEHAWWSVIAAERNGYFLDPDTSTSCA